ncbi:SMI1/KNR4 family protein [Marinobacter pelagius]|uniref:SMI1/KNR4 family protein n=1 Tax=Marinobacter sp. C7 TaxID=2951363 RepID=UPI001EF0E424|nr:SMI1/KNR4 family protein [Marinobacter sp. C7]MCG7200220.1 SMI1/KNR4 family protein [Marinobacter sp. C7]
MNQIYGKVFKATDGTEYGVLRKASGPYPDDVPKADLIAEDECGNFFLKSAAGVSFWDHETGQASIIAESMEEFVDCCVAPSEVELERGKVKSAWIDPEFAKEFGIDPEP